MLIIIIIVHDVYIYNTLEHYLLYFGFKYFRFYTLLLNTVLRISCSA